MRNIEESVIRTGNTIEVRERRPYGEPDEWRQFELDSTPPELPTELVMEEPEGRYLYSYLIISGQQQVVFNVTGFDDGSGPYRETVHGPYLLRQASVSSTVATIYKQMEDGSYRLVEEYRVAAEEGGSP